MLRVLAVLGFDRGGSNGTVVFPAVVAEGC